jgi:hypothetical protein
MRGGLSASSPSVGPLAGSKPLFAAPRCRQRSLPRARLRALGRNPAGARESACPSLRTSGHDCPPPRLARGGAWTRSGSSSAHARSAARSSSSGADVIAATATARGPVASGRAARPSTWPAGAISTAGAAASTTPPPSPVSDPARECDTSDLPGPARLPHRLPVLRHDRHGRGKEDTVDPSPAPVKNSVYLSRLNFPHHLHPSSGKVSPQGLAWYRVPR